MGGFNGPYRVANKVVLLVLSLELVSILLWGSLAYQAAREELLAALDRAERVYLDEMMKLSDAHEGLAAFMEKRKAVWKHA